MQSDSYIQFQWMARLSRAGGMYNQDFLKNHIYVYFKVLQSNKYI